MSREISHGPGGVSSRGPGGASCDGRSGVSSDPRSTRLAAADPWDDVVEERIVLAGREVVVVRPRDSIALLDEEAFEREEFLPYWADLWPSAVALARAVAARPLTGLRVLELGCGLGLPSLAAALAGARVLATDWSGDAVAFAAANAARNGLRVETQVCAWSQPEEIVDRAPWDRCWPPTCSTSPATWSRCWTCCRGWSTGAARSGSPIRTARPPTPSCAAPPAHGSARPATTRTSPRSPCTSCAGPRRRAEQGIMARGRR